MYVEFLDYSLSENDLLNTTTNNVKPQINCINYISSDAKKHESVTSGVYICDKSINIFLVKHDL